MSESENKLKLDSESDSTSSEVSGLELVELLGVVLLSWSTRASKKASTVGSSCRGSAGLRESPSTLIWKNSDREYILREGEPPVCWISSNGGRGR